MYFIQIRISTCQCQFIISMLNRNSLLNFKRQNGSCVNYCFDKRRVKTSFIYFILPVFISSVLGMTNNQSIRSEPTVQFLIKINKTGPEILNDRYTLQLESEVLRLDHAATTDQLVSVGSLWPHPLEDALCDFCWEFFLL